MKGVCAQLSACDINLKQCILCGTVLFANIDACSGLSILFLHGMRFCPDQGGSSLTYSVYVITKLYGAVVHKALTLWNNGRICFCPCSLLLHYFLFPVPVTMLISLLCLFVSKLFCHFHLYVLFLFFFRWVHFRQFSSSSSFLRCITSISFFFNFSILFAFS